MATAYCGSKSDVLGFDVTEKAIGLGFDHD
jgi:hypothetical protein